jgi:myo-inositol-1(or 4)-monophosphatase
MTMTRSFDASVRSLLFLLLLSYFHSTKAFLANPAHDRPKAFLPKIMSSSSSNAAATILDAEIDQKLLEDVLEVAVEASKKAGDIILGNSRGAEVTNRKANSRDLLTLVDPMCEKVIKETVLESFPDHDFLGEEDVPPGKEASAAALDANLTAAETGSGWLWIVDPIDGTTNFVNGMPLCMPSVAATYKGEVVVGVIYDCHRDELFTAIKGQGAYMNRERIQVGQQETIGDAVVAMGSPPGEESIQMSLKGIQALMPVV